MTRALRLRLAALALLLVTGAALVVPLADALLFHGQPAAAATAPALAAEGAARGHGVACLLGGLGASPGLASPRTEVRAVPAECAAPAAAPAVPIGAARAHPAAARPLAPPLPLA